VAAPQNWPPKVNSDQPTELQEIHKLVRERFESAERVQRAYRESWDEYYGLYRNFRKLRANLRGQTERDRDAVILGGRREFGAELFIPYCFTVIETIVPRVISNDPRMIVKPRSEASALAAQQVQELLAAQQTEISYDLKLQSVARSGLKYGLGVGKTYWEKIEKTVEQNRPRLILPGYQTVSEKVVVREGPQFEPVSIWDFFWDPAASSIETAEWVIHRTWRSHDYVVKKVQGGDWFEIDLDAAKALRSDKRRTEVWAGRDTAAGRDNANTEDDNPLHEVWEYWTRDGCYGILDRELCVFNDKEVFFHRELPFQIFRPTPQEHEFVGIGEIEPIKHLQYELNTLRSQRRDNATLVLQKAFIYADGFVDPNNLVIGPGKGIPVSGTDIRSVIQPLEFGDIPGSAFQESQEIKGDIELSSGVSESLAGGAGGDSAASDTATGIQLVQQAAGVRIRLKTKNLLAEVCRPGGQQFMELNRQYLLKPQSVRTPNPKMDSGYQFDQVGQEQLQQPMDYPIPDGTSTEPDNPAARQQSAMTLFQSLAQVEGVDQQKLATHLLREFDVKDPESYIVPTGVVPINLEVLQHSLESADLDPGDEDIVLEALESALEAGAGEEGSPPDDVVPPEDPQSG
jgi:hypothetical protein